MTTKKQEVKALKRDAKGLLGSVDYVFNKDGSINWRAMINDKWLYPNPSKNLPSQDISKLKDTDLCILLGGIKELAQIRGYTNVAYSVTCPSSDYVIANCTITWVPNYETENKEVTFSSLGDASFDNTSDIKGIYYLATTAENRAFVRSVRNFLKIHIVSKEELRESRAANEPYSSPQINNGEGQSVVSPCSLLESAMAEKGVTFTNLRKRLEKEDYPVEELSSVSDIPKTKIFELIERIKKIPS